MPTAIEDLAAERADLERRRPALAAELSAIEAEQREMSWEESASPDRAQIVKDAARSRRHSDLEARRRHLAAAVFKIDHRLKWLAGRLGEIESDAAYYRRRDWVEGLDPNLRELAERLAALELLVERVVAMLQAQGLPPVRG